MENLQELAAHAAREAAREILEEHTPKRWLTCREAADYLGVTVNYLERLRYTQDPDCPPYAKWGRQIRYDIHELDRFMKERTVSS